MAAISLSIRSNSARVCSALYPFSAGATENPIVFSVFIPRSTCIRFTRLFRNSPVGINSTADTITCAQTSNLRTRADAAVPELCPDSSFSVAADDARAASHAGYSPNSRPATAARPSPNPSTGHSRRASRKWIGTSSASSANSSLRVSTANPRPATPPTTASSRASVNICPINSPRPAPIAARIAIARRRCALRASSRFAAFAMAINSTSTVAPIRMISGVLVSSLMPLCPWLPSFSGTRVLKELRHFGLLLQQSRVHAVQRGLRLRPGKVLPRPPDQVQPVVAPAVRPVPVGRHQRLEDQRNVHVGLVPQRRPRETLGRHPHHGEHLAVHPDRLVEHRAFAAQPIAPIAVTQHRHRGSRAGIVLAPDRPPHQRSHAERRKIAARHNQHLPGNGLLAEGEVRVQRPERRDPAHALRPLLQLPKHRVAENVMHVAGIVRRVAPTLEVPWRRD